jgi:hypothetical protein
LIPLQQQKQISSSSTINSEIENGLDFILLHFDQDNSRRQQLFPRKIQTSKSEGRQIEVFSKQEALFYFKDSSFLDCRINAFPSYTEYKGIQRYPPDLIFIDIDRSNFKDHKSFEKALLKTLKNIKEKLNDGHPTVNNSGNGYHIIQPIQCPIVLEQIEQFEKYKEKGFILSQEFLRFAEDFLSNGKADPNHHPSFKSCLIRIPGSINGKCLNDRDKRLSGNYRVKTIQKWNGHRPPIPRELLEDFRTCLEQKITDQENNNYNYNYNNNNNNYNSNNNHTQYYKWVEQLLQTPIEDYRKLVLWKILCPYLINIRKLSYDESIQILREWLDKCNSIKRLDFSPNQKIKDNLKHVGNFLPVGIQKLKTDNEYRKLYQLLKKEKQKTL